MKNRLLAPAFALMVALGCSTDESKELLSVSNDTDMPIAVFPFPDGTLVDPTLHLPPGSFEENMIASGRRLGFDTVPGYDPEKGVTLFVYVVQRQGAEFAMTLTLTKAELAFLRGRISIDALPGCRITDLCMN